MNRKHKRETALVSAAFALMLLGAASALAQVNPPPADRKPNPLPPPSAYNYDTSNPSVTIVTTPQGPFPSVDPWKPGLAGPSNLLPTLYEDVKAADGSAIPNTLSSSPQHPYNLHPDPVVTPINKTSPTDDLDAIFRAWHTSNGGYAQSVDPAALQRAIDILEGNPVPDRVYSGIPMIHYNGPNKVKKVVPIKDSSGVVIGGTADVHQVWFDTHIESDTAFIDPSEVLGVPFTINYTIDTLNRGHEDFAPMQMYVDPTMGPPAMPLVTMDLTFFPMEEGTRTVYQMKMAPGKFFNLAYHWGWRRHPPRVEVHENALKVALGKTLVDWEVETFGADPRASQAAKEAAIGMIGDLAPSKRMWKGLRALLQSGANATIMAEVERAFRQWQDRNQLPDGVPEDPTADMTLFYVDNTIYGHQKGYINESQPVLDKWRTRGAEAKIKLINGDYFPHAYISVDFGGYRGWENTFHNTIPVGGAGPWFTFGRAYWEMNTPIPIMVPAATPPAASAAPVAAAASRMASVDTSKINAHKELWQYELDPEWKRTPHLRQSPVRSALAPTAGGDVLGEHTVILKLNYEASLRLRLYQFDPLHHEQAIWSVH